MQGNHAARRQFMAQLFARIPYRMREDVRRVVADGATWEQYTAWVRSATLPRGVASALRAYFLRVCAVRDERAYP